MPRFVLLRHQCPPAFKPSHWDFMLECDGALLTWALDALPCSWAVALGVEGADCDSVIAESLANHRLAYLDYEGPVADDRGSVLRWDAGQFDWLDRTPSRRSVQLHGEKLAGEVLLSPLTPSQWQLSALQGQSSEHGQPPVDDR